MGRKRFALVATSLTFILTLITIIAGTASATGDANSSLTLAAYVETATAITVEINSQATNTVAIDVIPASGVAFKESDEASITIASNNRTGIQANMIVDSPNLTHSEDDSYYIASITDTVAGYTPSEFPVNTWGLSFKEGNTYGNYHGFTTGTIPMFSNNAPATATQAFKFGTKIDTSLIPGSYSTTVSFVVVAKPSLYMQDVMYWKDAINIGESLQVIDNRDMKTYWVTRIETDPAIPDDRADCTGTGNDRVCSQLWMTQNLDLRLSANDTTFNHANTDLGWTDGDINTVWTPRNATTGSTVAFSNMADNTEKSFAYLETDSQYIYTSGTASNDIPYMDLEACIEAGHTEDDCSHYHRGTLYSFYTAAALGATSGGTAVAVSEEKYSVMPNSVCPAGWRLPTGLTSANDYTDFDYLLYQNDITAAHGGEDSVTGQSIDPGYATDGFIKLRTQPLWFVRTGCVGAGTAINNASNARYWANSINNGIHNGYYIDIFSNRVDPTDSTFTNYGFSVRCVAR